MSICCIDTSTGSSISHVMNKRIFSRAYQQCFQQWSAQLASEALLTLLLSLHLGAMKQAHSKSPGDSPKLAQLLQKQ